MSVESIVYDRFDAALKNQKLFFFSRGKNYANLGYLKTQITTGTNSAVAFFSFLSEERTRIRIAQVSGFAEAGTPHGIFNLDRNSTVSPTTSVYSDPGTPIGTIIYYVPSVPVDSDTKAPFFHGKVDYYGLVLKSNANYWVEVQNVSTDSSDQILGFQAYLIES